ncbi:MAG: cell division protein FtsQ/DivIB [Lactobacillaceae bacterium]|jgi:cell division protein FtsQ|nr:cell division protein FtsQ/DivIB [Lactobacillaceae bacterium]
MTKPIDSKEEPELEPATEEDEIVSSKEIARHLEELLGAQSDDENEDEIPEQENSDFDKQENGERQLPSFKNIFQAKRLGQIGWSQKHEHILTYRELHAVRMLLILGLAAIFLTLLLSPISAVKNIEVTGNSDLSKKEVLAAAKIHSRMSISELFTEQHFFIDSAKKNPQISQLQIKYLAANVVQIHIKEIVKVGFVKVNDKYYYVLADGRYIAAPLGEFDQRNLPLYDNFKSHAKLKLVTQQVGELSPALRNGISEVLWSPTKENAARVMLIMDDGNEVLVNANSLAKNMQYYPGMAVQVTEKGVVDLQVGAYFQPYGQ